jgi:hypothetical protein
MMRIELFRQMSVPLWIAALALVMAPFRSLGASVEPTTTVSGIEARELLIIVSDPIESRANPASIVGSSLPAWMDPLRPIVPSAEVDQPGPIGLIRFIGSTPDNVRVRLTAPSGVFYAAWPPARVQGTEIVWKELVLSLTPRSLPPMGPESWLSAFRRAPGLYVTSVNKCEKFLLYDVEFPLTTAFKLELNSDSIQIRNWGDAPLHDLVLYRRSREGGTWMSGAVDEVPPSPPTTRTLPADLPTVRLAPIDGDPVQFLTREWRTRLSAWDLDSAELNLIARELMTYALIDRQLTAVYRLDENQINRSLPLEITPPPARIRRSALVIVRNIDPELGRLIGHLIAQLGDPDWHKREAASALLASNLPAAIPSLRDALKSPDPEIALRVERLLAQAAAR